MFTNKQAKSVVDSKGNIWRKNLRISTKRRPMVPEIKEDMDEVMCKMPLNSHIVGRFLGLYDECKGRDKRINKISQELSKLWQKLSFPTISMQQISAKIGKLMKSFETHRKRKNEEFEKNMKNLFDITKVSGSWLCNEDKELYTKQIESGGRVGYTTKKEASVKTIHPSKRIRKSDQLASQVQYFTNEHDSTEEDNSSTDWNDAEECAPIKRKYESTKSAAKLVSKVCASTSKVSKVLQNLAEDKIKVPTPSQSGIWRQVIRDADKVKSRLKELLAEEEFCLHFDGKRIKNKEYQAVCLRNSKRTVQFGVLVCDSGTAKDIFIPLHSLLDQYSAWSSIKMIISDTTAVNTGSKNGVVVKFQTKFRQMGLDAPQFIGCQHHILDLILRHLMDSLFSTTTSRSPSINYQFIEDVLAEYENMKVNYTGTEVISSFKNPGWRDDFKFLSELCDGYNYYQKEKKWPLLKWKKLPSLHSARWNSRAIFALIAYFLFTKWRDQLKFMCDFIATAWAKAWFSNQHYSESIYDELRAAIAKMNCAKALKSFTTHWVKERSLLDMPRSNMVAEQVHIQ